MARSKVCSGGDCELRLQRWIGIRRRRGSYTVGFMVSSGDGTLNGVNVGRKVYDMHFGCMLNKWLGTLNEMEGWDDMGMIIVVLWSLF
jgi:hypothetical protein